MIGLKVNSNFIRHALFVITLLATLFSGPYLWISVLAWLFVAFDLLKSPEFAVKALVFFGTFFHRSCFLPETFFTIKHYYIGVLILLLARLVHGMLGGDFFQGLRRSRLLYPMLGV